MKRIAGAAVCLLALGAGIQTRSAHAAVQTANITVSGTTSPFTISYVLSQQATAMTVKIFAVGNTTTPVKTITVTDSTALTPGTHGTLAGNLTPVTWDGTNDSGTAVPGGNYYAQIHTTGAAIATATDLTALAPPTNPGWRAFKGDPLDTPPRVESRNVYGGGANQDPTSPLHNSVYFDIGKTNANNNGSSGPVYVNPDATSTFISLLTDRGAEGAYDYVAGDVESDGTLLLGGQGAKKLINVNPLTGATIATYGVVAGVGKIDVRELHVFGSGPTARVYFIDENATTGSLGTIAELSPINNVTPDPTTGLIYKTLVPTSALPTGVNTYGLAVNHTETSLWCAGYIGASNGLYINRFDKQPDGTWAPNVAFNTGTAAYITALGTNTGRIRGLALSPDEKVLWVSNNNVSILANNRVFGIDTTTGLGPTGAGGVDMTAKYQYYTYVSDSSYLTPGGLITTARDLTHATGTPYNVYVSGWDSIAVTSTFNSVAVIAPPDSGSDDTTISQPFVDSNATKVTVTAGPTFTAISDTSATVSWTTDLASSSTVRYGGAAGSYTSPNFTVAGNTTNHVVTLTNLAPGATYYIQVESDLGTLTPGLATGSFTTTADITILSESLTAATTSATLNFTTNVTSGGVIHWGDNSTTYNMADITVASGTSHTATFSGLTAGKTYYYQLALTDPNAIALTTLQSVFASAATGGTAASVTDTSFSLAHLVDLSGTGPVSLPAQGVPDVSTLVSSDLPGALYNEGAVAYNGYLYAIGGYDNSGTAQTAVYYIKINSDGSLDTTTGWQAAANYLPTGTAEISNASFAYNGYLYVVGGTDGTTVSTNVLYAPLDPATGNVGTWQTAANVLPAARTRGSAIVADGNVIVSGGATPINSINYVAQIKPDGSIGTWQTSSPLNGTRWLQRTVANDHHVYSVGGNGGSGAHNTSVNVAIEQPDASLTPFYQTQAYPAHGDGATDVGHYSAAGDILGGKLVIAGGGNLSGETGDDNARDLIAYSAFAADDLTGPWTAATVTLTTGVEDVDAAAYNNNLYVVGGRTLGVAGTSTDDPAASGIQSVQILSLDPDTTAGAPAYAYDGTLESRIIDLGALTNLMHIKVTSSGGSVETRYRFANTDGVFTDWFTASSADADITGGARWFQYELVLKGNGTATTTVSSVALTTGAGTTALAKADVVKALQIAGGLVAATSADVSRLDIVKADGSAGQDGKVTTLDAARIARKVGQGV